MLEVRNRIAVRPLERHVRKWEENTERYVKQ